MWSIPCLQTSVLDSEFHKLYSMNAQFQSKAWVFSSSYPDTLWTAPMSLWELAGFTASSTLYIEILLCNINNNLLLFLSFCQIYFVPVEEYSGHFYHKGRNVILFSVRYLLTEWRLCRSCQTQNSGHPLVFTVNHWF